MRVEEDHRQVEEEDHTLAEEGEASSHIYYEWVAGEEDCTDFRGIEDHRGAQVVEDHHTEAQAVPDHREAQGVVEEGAENGRKASMVESYEGDAEEKGEEEEEEEELEKFEEEVEGVDDQLEVHTMLGQDHMMVEEEEGEGEHMMEGKGVGDMEQWRHG
jgi:hypothetical protein